ncbi:Signal transduction histidine kinase [Mucilaginibacter gossypiicola]|uniref:histidine kinase n=1 Tax=Mucilaginibacter gossypiicola TaxID=551995 RepID=A0A1H8JXI3_9SPHI|nr:ATP-binding protein [Mucilaginibacter gossypiicola]SEN85429.1 Signal transduction histidine kinase [Mucilaginibacter gossypiicola]
MRRPVGLLLLLLMHGSTYAQKAGETYSQNSGPLIKTIDSLNKLIEDTYVSTPHEARAMAEHALLLSEKIKYNEGTGRAFMNLGHVYWSQSYYPISLFYFNSALTYLPQNKPLVLAHCYSSIGRAYTDLQNYGKALKNLNIAVRLAGHDSKMLAEVYNERSFVYAKLKQYDKGIALAKLAMQLSRTINDKPAICILYSRLANAYRLKGQYSQAIAYSDTALHMSYLVNNKRLRAISFTEQATIYNSLNQFDKAIGLARQGAALSDSIGVMDGISSAYKTITYSFEQKHDMVQSLAYQKKYIQALDSLNATNKRKNTELIQSYFELNSRLNAIAAVEQKTKEYSGKIHLQKTIIIILLVALFVVILALSITYYHYKQKRVLTNRMRKQHKALLIQNELIEEQSSNLAGINSLKDKLLAVIGHDLRTPLANLHAILRLYNTNVLTDAEVQSLMKEIEPVVQGAELTLSNLLEWAGSQIKGINHEPSAVDIYLIGVEMERIFSYLFQQKNIRFENVALPGMCVQADERHIKVVLSNLVSNAIKFTSDKGVITLSSVVVQNTLVISIADTGNGIPAEKLEQLFSLNTKYTATGTSGEKGTGVGLFLCRELIDFNGGTLWVNSEVNKGSIFSFSLPLVTD